MMMMFVFAIQNICQKKTNPVHWRKITPAVAAYISTYTGSFSLRIQYIRNPLIKRYGQHTKAAGLYFMG